MTRTKFTLKYGKHILHGDRCLAGSHVLLLHGAGKSSRTVFTRLIKRLAQAGIGSVSFDFIGHGETGGSLTGSSLQERTYQAAAVVNSFCDIPLTLIAASMSGYTAIKLTELFPVKNLILLVPAVYTPLAYDIPFGEDFSRIIRSPGSWRESDAFDILADYRGNLLIIAAESDEVIPEEVPSTIAASVNNAEVSSLNVIAGSTHTSLFPTDDDFSRAAEIIIAACGQDD